MPGGPPGLQNRWTARRVVGGFDSRPPPRRLEPLPGYIDTTLHRVLTPAADFQFVNVARWETAEAFLAATQSPGFRESAIGLLGYRPHPCLYRVVRT